MQHARLCLVALVLVLPACSDVALTPSGLEGMYHGTFTITHGTGLVQAGAVTFILCGDTYACTAESRYLPPDGAGYFQLIGRTLMLKDTAIHTAEFDWTLILNGVFSFTFDGSRLVLEQQDQEQQRRRTIDLRRK